MRNKVEVGKKLVALRGKKTQKEVAEANNISVSSLAMYETGQRVPRDSVKISLAHYYNTTVQDLFF